ncbi:MAG: response regulator [Promethearchaeota archaeon]
MPSIFIAEDDDQLRRFYKMALESKGYKIIGMAGDGEEAISMFKNLNIRPDIIILDYRMPNKNGIQILKEIFMIEERSKVIFASADATIKKEVMVKGAKLFLDKPFSLEELYKSVTMVLEIQSNEKKINVIEQDSLL